ncbi:MAG: hypothetical protein ACXV2C_00205 [Candidatus Bathyarchaeia archaeon]
MKRDRTSQRWQMHNLKDISLEADIAVIESAVKHRIIDAGKNIYYSDPLYYFEEETTSFMKKQWKSWKPLKQMKLCGIEQPDGSMDYKQYRLLDMWYDPNFFEQCNFLGMGSDGFTTSFNHPYDDTRIVRVRFYWKDKRVDIIYAAREPERPDTYDFVS